MKIVLTKHFNEGRLANGHLLRMTAAQKTVLDWYVPGLSVCLHPGLSDAAFSLALCPGDEVWPCPGQPCLVFHKTWNSSSSCPVTASRPDRNRSHQPCVDIPQWVLTCHLSGETYFFVVFLWFSLSSRRFLPPGVGLTGSSRPSKVLLEFKALILKTEHKQTSLASENRHVRLHRTLTEFWLVERTYRI